MNGGAPFPGLPCQILLPGFPVKHPQGTVLGKRKRVGLTPLKDDFINRA